MSLVTEHPAGVSTKPVISVILPMFRAEHIGWLPLESLCRQQEVNFEWELIIAEEIAKKYEPVGEKKIIQEYQDRLKLVGCSCIKYIGLNDWIPLGRKMSILINTTEGLELIVPIAADYYSSPRRLTSNYKIFKKVDPDWILVTKTIIYNIMDGKVLLLDSEGRKRKDDVGGKSMKVSVLKNALPKPGKINKSKGIDGFIFKASKKYRQKQNKKLNMYFDRSDNWKYCFGTYGINTITDRSARFENVGPPFKCCPIDLRKTIPSDILDRLISCKEIAKKHKRWLPKK